MSKHPDERIDQVLNALRDAQPPVGLEARIFGRIASTAEAHAVKPSRLGAIRNAVKKPRVGIASVKLYSLAGATLVLLLAVFTIVRISRQSSHPVAQARPLPVSARTYTPAQAQQISLAQAKPLGKTKRSRSTAFTAPLPPSPTAPDPDTVALAETLAPSHPAPPMPLTEQERLMLNVVRSGDQEEIAALDPAERDALFAQDQAAFHDFFAPPTQAPTTGEKE